MRHQKSFEKFELLSKNLSLLLLPGQYILESRVLSPSVQPFINFPHPLCKVLGRNYNKLNKNCKQIFVNTFWIFGEYFQM